MFLDDPVELEEMIRATGGVLVRWGERVTQAHKNAASEDMLTALGAAAQGVKHTLEFVTARLPELKQRELLRIGGTEEDPESGEEWEVRRVQMVDDGALSVALLATPRIQSSGG